MKLPRENRNAKYSVNVEPFFAYGTNESRVKLEILQDGELKAGLSFTEQETDDLIVVLTYYKNEQFPKAVADNG